VDRAEAEEWIRAHVEPMPRGAAPGRSRGERPLAMPLDVRRFFLDRPPERWRAPAP
jgi:hypothetical protein